MGMVKKEDESSTGHIWAAGFHHVMARSCLVRIFKLTNHLFFNFPNFFSVHCQPWILNSRVQWSTCNCKL